MKNLKHQLSWILLSIFISANLASTELSAASGVPGSSKPKELVFFDSFEYDAGREDKNVVSVFQKKGGWRWAKTNQAGDSGARGYLYTTKHIPGYFGKLPGLNSSRVLAIEARPETFGGQTDFYLQYGCADCPDETIPGNVWFQFWLYPNYYDDPENKEDQLSQFAHDNKFLYPCNGSYACDTMKWLLYITTSNINSRAKLFDGGNFLAMKRSDVGKPFNARAGSGGQGKMGQDDTSEYLVINRWTLVKIHFDTSRSSGNSFEAWLKPLGGKWTKVAEWIGGVTPGFTWTIPESQVGGHRVLRMPTTIPGGPNKKKYDSWMYMDDFAMSRSEAALPKYRD